MLILMTAIVLTVLVLSLLLSMKKLAVFERGVIFTRGRRRKMRGPGVIVIVPFFQTLVRVDLRIQVPLFIEPDLQICPNGENKNSALAAMILPKRHDLLNHRNHSATSKKIGEIRH